MLCHNERVHEKLSYYERGLPYNSIFMRRGAPWEHESSVASFPLRHLRGGSPAVTQHAQTCR